MWPLNPFRQHGFTLAEAVIVIVITGILSAIVAVFIKSPVDSYFDSARRAALTDAADSALRRISRDLRRAVPNSIRPYPLSAAACVGVISTYAGGRYRAEQDCSSSPCTGDILDFGAGDGSFDVIGTLPDAPVSGDRVVVYNLGIPGADAYNGDNTAIVAAGGSTTRVNIASKQFPFSSPGFRFQIIPKDEPAVFYLCDLAQGRLLRYSGHAIADQPATCVVPAGATASVLAEKVSLCQFTFSAGVTQRDGLASLKLELTDQGEKVSLYHEVHINNVP
jgi:MSHA biogenesis protein MshO